jgi:hypothetical protein
MALVWFRPEMLYEFCSCHAFSTGKLHHVHALRQVADVYLRLGLGELADDERLTFNIHN